jgi:hypothetical protein
MNVTVRSRHLARKISVSQCFVYIAKFGFTQKQMVKLQHLNKLFYKRVAQWVRIVSRKTTLRRSVVVCPDTRSTKAFLFPARATIDDWLANGVLHPLVGLENNLKDGTGQMFNFISSNGKRSQQRDEENLTKFTFLIPEDAKISSVDIYYNKWILGFKFYDKGD